ncbi:hypothetical protein V7F78_12245, partial [Cutibacterium avidum]
TGPPPQRESHHPCPSPLDGEHRDTPIDLMPRVQIERNLTISLLMQLDHQVDPAAVAAKLPPYELADSLEGRAVDSVARVMAAIGLTTEHDDGKVLNGELIAWFADHDEEVDEA